jgi:hypothetical protein
MQPFSFSSLFAIIFATRLVVNISSVWSVLVGHDHL